MKDCISLMSSIPHADIAFMESAHNKAFKDRKEEIKFAKIRYRLTKEIVYYIKNAIKDGKTFVRVKFIGDEWKASNADETFFQMFRDMGYSVSVCDFDRTVVFNFDHKD